MKRRGEASEKTGGEAIPLGTTESPSVPLLLRRRRRHVGDRPSPQRGQRPSRGAQDIGVVVALFVVFQASLE